MRRPSKVRVSLTEHLDRDPRQTSSRPSSSVDASRVSVHGRSDECSGTRPKSRLVSVLAGTSSLPDHPHSTIGIPDDVRHGPRLLTTPSKRRSETSEARVGNRGRTITSHQSTESHVPEVGHLDRDRLRTSSYPRFFYRVSRTSTDKNPSLIRRRKRSKKEIL